MTIKRIYPVPQQSCFILGPRGTGKSTFVKDQVKPDLIINLLDTRRFLSLQKDPGLLVPLVTAMPRRSRICIDEIQKVPALLDEVHRLIEEGPYSFILTGSSARKLKQSGTNLLAGRATTQRMFPFSVRELATSISIERMLEVGSLPVVLRDEPNAEDILESYVDTYLKEEIREEALTRSLDQFSRFLEVAAQLNGRVLSYENLASETGKSGDTIKKWYGILEDTLLGVTIPAFRPGFKVREVGHAKFYFFDPGVARAAAGLLREPLDAITKGFALETLVLNELRIYREVAKKPGLISYYQTQTGESVDFIFETQKKTVDRPGKFATIEVKASTRWRSEFEKPSRNLAAAAKNNLTHMVGVYLGKDILKFGDFVVYPFADFVEWLHGGGLYTAPRTKG